MFNFYCRRSNCQFFRNWTCPTLGALRGPAVTFYGQLFQYSMKILRVHCIATGTCRPRQSGSQDSSNLRKAKNCQQLRLYVLWICLCEFTKKIQLDMLPERI